jgi:hypothetical protein
MKRTFEQQKYKFGEALRFNMEYRLACLKDHYRLAKFTKSKYETGIFGDAFKAKEFSKEIKKVKEGIALIDELMKRMKKAGK